MAGLIAGADIMSGGRTPHPYHTRPVFRLGMLAERAGLPDGVLNIITADPPDVVGDTFSSDPRVRNISFTGSVKTGKNLMRIAARTLTKIGLELGGNNAFIVFEDADLDAAVEAAVVAKPRRSGKLRRHTTNSVCAKRGPGVLLLRRLGPGGPRGVAVAMLDTLVWAGRPEA
jgi:aldehyde dehydrogenase family protein